MAQDDLASQQGYSTSPKALLPSVLGRLAVARERLKLKFCT